MASVTIPKTWQYLGSAVVRLWCRSGTGRRGHHSAGERRERERAMPVLLLGSCIPEQPGQPCGRPGAQSEFHREATSKAIDPVIAAHEDPLLQPRREGGVSGPATIHADDGTPLWFLLICMLVWFLARRRFASAPLAWHRPGCRGFAPYPSLAIP